MGSGFSARTYAFEEGPGRSPAGGTDKIHPSKGTRTDGSAQQKDEFTFS